MNKIKILASLGNLKHSMKIEMRNFGKIDDRKLTLDRKYKAPFGNIHISEKDI